MIYFDNAATTGHKPMAVGNAIYKTMKNLTANPGRSGHSLSQAAAMTVYKTRLEIADFFGAHGPENVIFTANCTHSINFVLKGIITARDHVIVSDLEHNAVMRPLNTIKANYDTAQVSFSDDTQTVENFKKLIKPETKMIFCTAASNVIGKALPLKEIGELCRKKKILFAVDAAQGAGVLPINMKEMNIDFLCIAPHKGLYAPMGLGILIAQKPISYTVIEGGTGTDSINFKQPDVLPEMLESGTINFPAISALNDGINFVKSKKDCILKYEMNLVNKLYDGLSTIPDIKLYCNPKVSVYAPVLSFNIAGVPSDIVARYLSDNGFALRAGLHCAPTAHKKIGTLEGGTVRFSPSVFNTLREVDLLINTIKNFRKSKITID